ncbi:MAG: penicillin-binding transpeptidase domain-containing protein [Microbacterium gubbeenense]|uniref:penicillin-binding transpeptidase domain-containing protein n=1 Tax=Microbacterium gubbeenense TaxID=159896 RepID=UPI003F9A31D5
MLASRTTALVTVAAVLAVGLTACSPAEGLDQEISELTSKIENRSLDGFDGPAEALAEYDVEVTASDPVLDGETAAVDLDLSWHVDDEVWEYQVPVDFARVEGQWTTDTTASDVAGDLDEGETIEITREYPERADIVGSGGEEIVTERPVSRFGLDKSWISLAEVEGSAFRIGEALGIDADEFAARAVAAGEEAFVEAIVLRPEASDRVDADYYAIPGARAVDDVMLLAPTRVFARDLLGTAGEATAELIEGSDGDIAPGDQVGFSGLQKAYDERLRGTPKTTIEAVAGEERRTLVEWEAAAGDPLETTLDVDLQKKADRVLAGTSGTASIVAIRPSTGEILAAADSAEHDVANAATAGQYAPGSTFKIVTALALLRSGMSPDDTVACKKTLTVDGFEFHNDPGYPSDMTGKITLREAIANSCNTAMIALRDKIDDEALADAAASLGLDAEADLGVPAFLGDVPTPESETERAAALIGQGKVLASPLAMATVAASVAEGATVTPHVVVGEEGEADSGEPAPAETETPSAPASPSATAAPSDPAPLSADEAAALRDMMRAAVTDGSASILSKIDPAVAAKTGTAEYGEPDSKGAYPSHAWLIATQGDLAVAVFVARGKGGAATAGPLMREMLG